MPQQKRSIKEKRKHRDHKDKKLRKRKGEFGKRTKAIPRKKNILIEIEIPLDKK